MFDIIAIAVTLAVPVVTVLGTLLYGEWLPAHRIEKFNRRKVL